MSDFLKFACPVPNCGRKFSTKEKLEAHIKLRHPLLSSNPQTTTNAPKKEITKTINTKTTENKPNNQILQKNNTIKTTNEIQKQPIKQTTNINTKIQNEKNEQKNLQKPVSNIKETKETKNLKNNKIQNDNNTIKKTENINTNKEGITKEKKVEKRENIAQDISTNSNNKNPINDEKTIKQNQLANERHKLILDNLYSKINDLENYFENESIELQKQFELSEIPIFDNIEDDQKSLSNNSKHEEQETKTDEKEKENEVNEKEKEKETENENDKKINEKENENEIKTEKKDEKEKEKEPEKKFFDTGKIIEITDDMIFKDTNFEDYDEFEELDLSKKNIASFMHNRKVPFNYFSNLTKLNLSYNWMTYSYDIRYFTKLKELYINDNKIDEISFCESLPFLEILNAENNQISLITPISKCHNLKILKLSLNKIQYIESSINAIKSLRILEELTIKDNPFLEKIFAYKQYFSYIYQNLLKLDDEEINDIDRDIAAKFVRENSNMYKINIVTRPMSSRQSKNNENNLFDIENDENNFAQTQTMFRVGNAIITKEMHIPYKSKFNRELKENELKKKKNEIIENDELKDLKEIIKDQQKEIDDIKLELENVNQLNKEYEIIINNYKIKSELKKTNNNNLNNKSKNQQEKNKLLQELEMWKKEYYDLFDRTKTESKNKNKINEINEINENNDDEINMNLYRSMPFSEIKNYINRPQTATIKSTKSTDFEKLCDEIRIMKTKNTFEDVLNEDTDDENEKKNDNEKNNDENEDDEIPDDEIDEIFRRSVQDIQKMREDIKTMNENLDKKNNNNKKLPITNIGQTKTTLRPVIVKKENASIGILGEINSGNKQGKMMFGSGNNNKGNDILGNNNNIGGPSQRYQGKFNIKKP